MAYAIVQQTSVQRTGVTTTTLAYGSDLTAGNLAVVSLTYWQVTISSISWSVGGSASPSLAVNSHGTDARPAIYYAANTSSGAHTVSITLSSSNDVTMMVHEYSGCETTSPLDKTETGGGTGTSITTATTTALAQANNMVHSVVTHESAGTIDLNAGSGFTRRQHQPNGSSAMPGASEDMGVTATTGVAGTWTAASSVSLWRAIVAVFKESAGGAPTTRAHRLTLLGSS